MMGLSRPWIRMTLEIPSSAMVHNSVVCTFPLFQEEDKSQDFSAQWAVGRELLVASVKPPHGSSFHRGAGRSFSHGIPLLGSGNRCLCSLGTLCRYLGPGTTASCHSEELHLCCGV